MDAKLRKLRSRFSVGLILAAIGFVFLQTPPVNGVLSLTIAPALLLIAFLVMIPMGLAPAARFASDQDHAARDPRSPVAAYACGAAVFAVTLVSYCATMWPGPGWWDSSEYITCAYTLGVTGPPGSFLLQLAGHFFGFIGAIESPAVRINFMIAVAAATTVTVSYFTLLHLFRLLPVRRRSTAVSVSSAVIGSLTIAFSVSVWQHATFTNPYALSLLMGILLIYTAVRWWESADRDGGGNYLLIAAFLFGLDLSVHRSNILLAPAFVALVLIRKPRALADWRLWLGAVPLCVIGASLQLGVMLRATLSPEINLGNPDTLPGLWSYLTLSQYGIKTFGSDLLQRKAELWDYQINHLYLRYLGWNFLAISSDGSSVAWRPPFGLPALAAATGLVYLWAKHWRIALWTFIAFLCAAGLAIFYLNAPAGFFREMDRHFLVSFAIVGLWAACGVFAALNLVLGWFRRRPIRAPLLAGLVLLAVLPAGQLIGNVRLCDMRGNHAPTSWGRNTLDTCEEEAILFTAGDNDTFPLWYLQIIEGYRRDITVLNIPLLNTPWYLETMRRYHRDLPLSIPDSLTATLTPVAATRDTVRIVDAADDADTAVFVLQPSYGDYLLVADQVVLDILKTNSFWRPVYFSIGFGDHLPLGLSDLSRLDGMAWRLVVTDSARSGTGALQRNLLGTYHYAGFELRESMDPTTRQTLPVILGQFARLADELRRSRQDAALADVTERRLSLWPELTELLSPTAPDSVR